MARSSTLRGVLWMSGAVLSFCGMAIAARELLRTMGTFEILFFRTVVAFVIVLALAARYGTAGLRTRRIGVHLWRNLFHFGGQAAWVFSIGVLPLATVFAIEFTMPIWVAVLAALILGERITRSKVVMLALGIVGVLVILRPGLGFFEPAALVMLFGSMCFAMNMIGTKRLSGTDSPLSVLFWMSVIQTPISLAAALPAWVGPGARDIPWIVAMGIGSFAAHYCLTRAMHLADATVVVPVDFFRLPLIAVVGAAVYGEAFDPFTLAGAALMFAGTYYSLSRERRPALPARS
jgi:drug/metabolite transporter (DMT)-like permease